MANDSTKNIIFKTTVENAQSVQLLDQFGNSIRKTEQELSKTADTVKGKVSPSLNNFSRRDVGYLASQLLYTSGVTGRFGSQLTNLASGFATGSWIGAGFAGFASLVGLITEEIKKATLEADMLAAAFKRMASEMIKIKSPLAGYFEFDPKVLDAVISKLDRRIQGLQNLTSEPAEITKAFYGVESEEQRQANEKRLEDNQTLLENFKKQKIELQAFKEVYDMLDELGGKWVDTNKKVTEEIKKHKEMLGATPPLLKSFVNALSEYGALSALTGMGGGIPGTGGGGLRPGGLRQMPPNPMDAMIEQMKSKDVRNSFRDMVVDWTSIMQGEFSKFWETTFGEANSLLEQLLKMTFTSILADIAGTFLSFLPGGSIIGFIGSLFSPARIGGTTSDQPVILRIGDEDVGTFVRKGNEYNRMRRLT